jgi:Ricin-type beta-trefoil lectin domain
MTGGGVIFAGFRIAAAVALAAAADGGLASISAAAPAAVVPCSVAGLISAVQAANTTQGGSSVTLTSSCVYPLTVPNNTTDGGTGLPVVAGHVSIQGNGATITRSAAAGTAAFRIFDVALGGSLTLNSVTLSNGLADDGVNGGGAIFSRGSLTVTRATFSGNSSPAATGTSGGAINSSGSLTVSLSTFTGNTAQEGGGIFDQSTTGAGTVTDSTFTGNTATIFGGGALVTADGATNLTHDTFSRNIATGSAGGGAIDNDATVNVTDSTFTGNTAGTNGGGAVQNFGTATISWSTLSANSSPFGANLHNFTTGSPMTVSNSIVANGLGGGSNCSGSPAIVDGGYNIDSGASCGFSAANHSENSANPGLGALASNGGPTQTMALAANSPAVNAIPATVPGCARSTDQRGVSRPQGPACDIGAYELIMKVVPPPGGPIRGYAGKCVDDFHGGTGNGVAIDVWGCNGTAAQRWVFASNGQLRIFGKCLDDTRFGGNGTRLQLYACTGASNQKWTHRSNGEYVLRSNGLCLDDPGFSRTNGTRLDIWHCNGGANQRWSLPV